MINQLPDMLAGIHHTSFYDLYDWPYVPYLYDSPCVPYDSPCVPYDWPYVLCVCDHPPDPSFPGFLEELMQEVTRAQIPADSDLEQNLL
jgi:hypothetical protein